MRVIGPEVAMTKNGESSKMVSDQKTGFLGKYTLNFKYYIYIGFKSQDFSMNLHKELLSSWENKRPFEGLAPQVFSGGGRMTDHCKREPSAFHAPVPQFMALNFGSDSSQVPDSPDQ